MTLGQLRQATSLLPDATPLVSRSPSGLAPVREVTTHPALVELVVDLPPATVEDLLGERDRSLPAGIGFNPPTT